MSTNGVDTNEDTDMVDYEEEKVVTMMDVLQQQKEFEEDANAVLGASDDKNCTYSKGYIKRQAVYACLTCCSDAKTDPTKRAGVCLACSLNCHENHELIELYTRRNFRCDCGNPKFNSHPCQFTENKTDLNEDNNYNQNFIGIYCTCHRPYPDPDAEYEDEMIQCSICEDWLHASHLEATLPSNDQYSEMICKACMEMNEFLHDYSYLAVNVDSEDVDIITVNKTMDSESNINAKTDEIVTNGLSTSAAGKDDMIMESGDNNESLSENTFESTNIEKESIVSINSISEERIIESNTLSTKTKEIQESLHKVTNDIPNDVFFNTNEQSAETINEADNEFKNLDQITEKIDEEPDKTDLLHPIEPEIIPKNSEVNELTINTYDKVTDKNDEESLKTNFSQSTELNSEDGIAPEDFKVSELTVKNNDHVTEQIDEVTDKNNAVTTDNTILKNLEDSETESKIENQPKQQMDEVMEISCKVDSENTVLNNLQTSELETEIGDDCMDTISKEIDQTDILESAAVKGNIDAALKNVDSSELETIISDQINENKIEKSSDTLENATKELLELTSDIVDKSEEDLLLEGTTAANKELNSNEKISEEHISGETETNENACEEINDNEPEKCKIKKLTTTNTPTENMHKRKLSDANEDVEVKKTRFEDNCTRPKGVRKVFKGATFWTSEFRQKLCTCNECLMMYKDLRLLFLLDPEDTVTAYETLGKEKSNGTPTTQYEQGLQALSSLDRVQQINALTEYNLMRDKLLDFFKSFKERKQVVTEEDIKAFFAGMKPRREPDGVYFCR